MKKIGDKTFDKAASIAIGSTARGGVDVAALYIDMLCERFKDRGIRTSVRDGADAQEKKDSARSRLISLYPRMAGVSAEDEKYKSLNVNGRSCMSSDDFANYYKDLRDYKMPRFYSRAEREYEEADAALEAERVQESGKSPKKAVWLAITNHVKGIMHSIKSHLNKEGLYSFAKEWLLYDDGEELKPGKKRKMPKRVIPVILAVALSLMMVVCSSVMVSRASQEVSSLEDKIDSLSFQIRDLEGKLEVKNNMLDIKRIAVEEYGMISAGYASSRYVDVREEEKLEGSFKDDAEESWLTQLLRAIGFDTDKSKN